MKILTIFSCIALVWPFQANAQLFQLAPPFIKASATYFIDSVQVELLFSEADTQIRFTLNGEEPTEESSLYTVPFYIQKHFAVLRARVFGKDYLPSDIVGHTFLKKGLPIASVTFPKPHPKYAGNGANTLVDNIGGGSNYQDGTWLGFQDSLVKIEVTLPKKRRVKQLFFHVLENQDAWIFFPDRVIAYQKCGWGRRRVGALRFRLQPDENTTANGNAIIVLSKNRRAKKLQLHFYTMRHMPAKHPGAGQASWLFIDEIKAY